MQLVQSSAPAAPKCVPQAGVAEHLDQRAADDQVLLHLAGFHPGDHVGPDDDVLRRNHLIRLGRTVRDDTPLCVPQRRVGGEVRVAGLSLQSGPTQGCLRPQGLQHGLR